MAFGHLLRRLGHCADRRRSLQVARQVGGDVTQPLNQPKTMRIYVTVGMDGKAVVSGRKPVSARVPGTDRLGLYPRVECGVGDPLWIPGQCLEGIEWLLGFVPAVGESVGCELTLRPILDMTDR